MQYLLTIFSFLIIGLWIHISWSSKAVKWFPQAKRRYLLAWIPVFLFTIKSIAGILYTYVAIHFFPNQGDIGVFFDDGMELYRIFLESPGQWLAAVKQMFSFNSIEITNTESAYLRSGYNFFKLLQFSFSLVSGGNIYINTLLFNGISTAVVLSFSTFLFRQWKAWQPILLWMLFPSLLFYSSGIHKEGVVLILIMLIIKWFFNFVQRKSLLLLLPLLLSLLLLFYLKVFVALSLLYVIMFWLLAHFYPRYWKALALVFFTIPVFLVFISGMLPESLDIVTIISKRQQAFKALEAASSIYLPDIEPGISTFVSAIPAALFNVFIRPLPGDGGKWLYTVFTFEILLMWGAIIYMVFSKPKTLGQKSSPLPAVMPFIGGLFIFAFINLILIGFTIPNMGALVRYRSIFLPLFPVSIWFFAHYLSRSKNKY